VRVTVGMVKDDGICRKPWVVPVLSGDRGAARLKSVPQRRAHRAHARRPPRDVQAAEGAAGRLDRLERRHARSQHGALAPFVAGQVVSRHKARLPAAADLTRERFEFTATAFKRADPRRYLWQAQPLDAITARDDRLRTFDRRPFHLHARKLLRRAEVVVLNRRLQFLEQFDADASERRAS
jgi:hypothetical protein